MAHSVVVADDHEALRAGLRALLPSQEWAVVAEASNGEETLAAVVAKAKKPGLLDRRKRRRAAYGVSRDRDEAGAHELGAYEGLEIAPVPIDADWMTQTRGSRLSWVEKPSASSCAVLALAYG